MFSVDLPSLCPTSANRAFGAECFRVRSTTNLADRLTSHLDLIKVRYGNFFQFPILELKTLWYNKQHRTDPIPCYKGDLTVQYDVVMVTYNSAKWVPGCIQALAKVHSPLENLHLIVVDNASTDDTLEQLTALRKTYLDFGGFTIEKSSRNRGFGAACNLGAQKGSSPLLFFLNLDTEVDPEVFLRLDEAERLHPEAGGFECRQLPYETGHHIDPVTLETSWASGAALAVRRDVFEQVDGFDEHLFMYCEDVDLSWRIRAAGYPLYYVPKAKVNHYSHERAQPKLGEYAGSFYGNLLLRYKFGGWRDILEGHQVYLGALRRPLHFDKVRRVLAVNYLRHFIHLWPFLFWRFAHRGQYKARTAQFDGGFSPDRGLKKAMPLPPKPPLVSVIVRTCGRPETLRQTLLALRHQTYPNFEIIIADDGPAAARQMIQEDFQDLSIHYVNDGKWYGRARNGNRGLSVAKGTLCNFLDDDDFFYPDHLEMLAGELCAHPKADLVLGSAMAMFVSGEGRVTEIRPMIFDRIDRFTMCQECRIPIQTVMFRHKLFEVYGGLLETLDAHEDWGMWLRYLEHGRRITPYQPDIRRATSIFVQPAEENLQRARAEQYQKSDAHFFSDNSLCFEVTLGEMRRYYDDMIADLRCLEERGELHEFLARQSRRNSFFPD